MKKKIFILSYTFLLGCLFSCKSPENEYLITITTSLGDIQLILFDQTPKHKDNFLKLVDEKFYDDMSIHAIINPLMVVMGDPQTKNSSVPGEQWGKKGIGYTIPQEINPNLKLRRGSIAAIRDEDSINPEKASDGSNFAIILYRNELPQFDGKYTVFGQVVSGYEVLDLLGKQPVNQNKPLQNIKIKIKATSMTKTQITQTFGYVF
jgi:cyclophilin family peptidyl-prolyl cis-trans isomerase